jgi:hypothetical protein
MTNASPRGDGFAQRPPKLARRASVMSARGAPNHRCHARGDVRVAKNAGKTAVFLSGICDPRQK